MGRVRDLGQMGDRWEGEAADGTPVHGVALSGSPNVRVNNHPATRTGDVGIAHTPGGPLLWRAVMGASSTLVNGASLHRRGELTIAQGAHGHLGGREGEASAAATPRRRHDGETVVVWRVVAGTAYVRNRKNWVLGVLKRGDKIVATRVDGSWVHGRATADSKGFKGRGKVLIDDKKRREEGDAGHSLVLRRERVPRAEARLGTAERAPRIEALYRYARDSNRDVATHATGGSGVYLTHELSGETIGHIGAGEHVGIRYVTDGAAMVRKGDDWGFVHRGAVRVPPPRVDGDQYEVRR